MVPTNNTADIAGRVHCALNPFTGGDEAPAVFNGAVVELYRMTPGGCYN